MKHQLFSTKVNGDYVYKCADCKKIVSWLSGDTDYNDDTAYRFWKDTNDMNDHDCNNLSSHELWLNKEETITPKVDINDLFNSVANICKDYNEKHIRKT